jgi:ribosome-binding ATPase
MLVGIVGRPNVGKSTFFKAATLSDVLIAPYPFATIKPNHGMAYVKIVDLAPEFGKISNPREGYVKGEKGKWRFVPFELMDVAGLVEGASEGKGLGNEFLNNLAGADAFIHVVDMSGETDAEGKPAENCYPGKDLGVIESELDKWYLGILMKVWRVFARTIEMQKQNFAIAVAKQFSGLKVTDEDVKHVVLKINLNPEKPSAWKDSDIMLFARELRRYTKPMIIAANKMDRPDAKANLERIKKEFDYPIVPCFADGELALREADKHGLIEYIPGESDFKIVKDLSEKQKFALEAIRKVLKEYSSTGVQEILNKTVFDILKYIAIFPAGDKLADSKGNVLPDCYLMPPGSTALDFAFRLHTDIGKNFVKAIHVRTKKAVGKEYKLQHRDGMEIMVR